MTDEKKTPETSEERTDDMSNEMHPTDEYGLNNHCGAEKKTDQA